ncbi:hypothetical protein ACF1BS_03395 [Streptomyces sp. NPDC014748]|uniref:hypothetical protein n=1 Tax=Streptomyces sp. NPDC014748 TaxID=3364905 RepID=UPI0036F51FB3
MANVHKHRQRVIRGAPDDLWEDLDTATKAAGTDRSAVTRQFWEWYVQRPGATVPQPPEVTVHQAKEAP